MRIVSSLALINQILKRHISSSLWFQKDGLSFPPKSQNQQLTIQMRNSQANCKVSVWTQKSSKVISEMLRLHVLSLILHKGSVATSTPVLLVPILTSNLLKRA